MAMAVAEFASALTSLPLLHLDTLAAVLRRLTVAIAMQMPPSLPLLCLNLLRLPPRLVLALLLLLLREHRRRPCETWDLHRW